jgi:hypothetical protein
MSKNKDIEINSDSIEEVREVLKYAMESHSWLDVEEALELINEVLGYEPEEDEEEGTSKRNHLEE